MRIYATTHIFDRLLYMVVKMLFEKFIKAYDVYNLLNKYNLTEYRKYWLSSKGIIYHSPYLRLQAKMSCKRPGPCHICLFI